MTKLRALNSSHSIFIMTPGGRNCLNSSEATCSGIFQQVGGVRIQIQLEIPTLSLFVIPPNAFLTVKF